MISFIETIQKTQGTKPFFIYDLDRMKVHLDQFKIDGVRFWYAAKANPLSRILQTAFDSGFGIDCASRGEMNQALRSGVTPDRVLLTGPSKAKEFLKEALAAGVRIFVLESIQQALDLENLACELQVKPRALLRLQLQWEGAESSVLGGSQITPFGLDFESWMPLKEHEFRQVQIEGVHCFQWGNLLDLNKLYEIWLKTMARAKDLAGALDFKLKILDVGGGVGIPYHGEAEVAFSELQEKLQQLKKMLPDTEVWMELGRYAVGSFGYYVSKVMDRKTVQGKEMLILEGGIHHLARPALVGEAFPMSMLPLSSSQEVEAVFEIHGPLCTSLDHLGNAKLNASVKRGDSLIFHQCGAYGFTESMPYFLCHDLPAEFVIHHNALSCLRPWVSPESWLK